MTAARSRMAEKIAALRAKTAAAGCTEAEALAAADLAARLMREHGVSEAELDMSEARGRALAEVPSWHVPIVNTIAWCTNTSVILLEDERCWLFTGREPGPEIAVYLREVCFRAVATGERLYKSSKSYRNRRSIRSRRQALVDFRAGVAFRLRWRLQRLFGPVHDDAAQTAAREVAHGRRSGLVTHDRRMRPAKVSAGWTAGWKAGGDVALNHGVGGESTPPLLGRRP